MAICPKKAAVRRKSHNIRGDKGERRGAEELTEEEIGDESSCHHEGEKDIVGSRKRIEENSVDLRAEK